MLNKVFQAGQVNINACDILRANSDGINVSSLIEKISIFEDILSPFVSGELVLRDTFDIPNTLGRSTRDLLRLDINTPGNTKDLNVSGYFLIYKISNRQLASDRSQLYTIHFCSEEMMMDAQKKISKSYKGSPDSIIQNIIQTKLDSQKKFVFDKPSNTVYYVSNYWSPSKNFRYLIENSLDIDSNPGFLFFENREGFNYKSLPIISKQPIDFSFVANDFVATMETTNPSSISFGSVSRDPIIDYTVIREMRVDSTFDYLDFIQKGGSKSVLYTHDLVSKKVKIENFDLSKESHHPLNPNRFMSDDVIANTEPTIMTLSKATSGKDYTNARYIQKRASLLAQYQAFRIEIDVFGKTDYTVGKKVNLSINQTRAISRDEDSDSYLDKLFSGDYIISKVAHHIGRKEHLTTLELIKDSTLLK